MISQAHLDPVWVWPWRDGCAETMTTIQSALDRMTEFPQFKFSRSCASTYQWVKKFDPALYGRIGEMVKAGRWEIVNGWIVQPDCNLPSTESFVRQSLYGKRFFTREFGKDVCIGYNVDSFGHAAGLPQLLSKAGFKYYVMMRPMPNEASLPMLFWWEGDDGSRVLTWRINISYCQGMKDPVGDLDERLKQLDAFFAPGFNCGAMWLGVGDHGGGPTRAMLSHLEKLRKENSELPEIIFGTLTEFFAELEKNPSLNNVPVIKGDLLHHAPGYYAALKEIKTLNRKAEKTLLEAEALSTIHARIFPENAMATVADFEKAWWKVLFNQFHDIMAGTSIASTYDDARTQLGSAIDYATDVNVGVTQFLARQVNTQGVSESVYFALNPLPWARKGHIEADMFMSFHANGDNHHLKDQDGIKYPIQWTPAEASFGPHGMGWKHLNAIVDLPAGGYKVFEFDKSPAATEPCTPMVDAVPAISSLGIMAMNFRGRNYLRAPAGLSVMVDQSDTWGHDEHTWHEFAGMPLLTGTKTISDGPLMKIIRQNGRWNNSEMIMDIITYRDLPVVELRLKINWQEKRQMLKLEIPTGFQAVENTAKVAGGVSKRSPDGHEYPFHDWTAICGTITQQRCGMQLISRDGYSYDCNGPVLRTVLVKGVPFAEHKPFPIEEDNPWQDQGWSEHRLWLAPYDEVPTYGKMERMAADMTYPVEGVVDCGHNGKFAWEDSLWSLTGDPVKLCAFKQAEDSDVMILRLQELDGNPAKVQLRLNNNTTVELSLRPYALASWKITISGNTLAAADTDLLEH